MPYEHGVGATFLSTGPDSPPEAGGTPPVGWSFVDAPCPALLTPPWWGGDRTQLTRGKPYAPRSISHARRSNFPFRCWCNQPNRAPAQGNGWNSPHHVR